MAQIRPMLVVVALLMLPGIGRADNDRGTPSFDTEHIFGFTEGAEIGEKGEKELEATTMGRFGKHGSFAAVTQDTAYRYGVTDGFRASIGTLFDYHRIRGVPGLDDRQSFEFSGVSSEFRWRLLERGSAPFALTLSFAPQWRRIEDVSGERAQSYLLPLGLLADAALIPNKLYVAVNLTYEPTFTRSAGAWQQEHPVEVSTAIAGAVREGVFLGGEIRHITRNQGGLFTGHVLFAGPSLFVKLSDTLAIKAAWSAQIPDQTSGRLDLVNYERHQVRALLVKGF